jgi:hypothetical protein
MLKLLFIVTIALHSIAANNPKDITHTSKALNSHTFTPCLQWYRDFETRNYICRSTGMSIRVPDSNTNQRRIDNLEERIRKLEQGLWRKRVYE